MERVLLFLSTLDTLGRIMLSHLFDGVLITGGCCSVIFGLSLLPSG